MRDGGSQCVEDVGRWLELVRATRHEGRNPVSWKIHIRAINGPETEYAILVFCITRARGNKSVPCANTVRTQLFWFFIHPIFSRALFSETSVYGGVRGSIIISERNRCTVRVCTINPGTITIGGLKRSWNKGLIVFNFFLFRFLKELLENRFFPPSSLLFN